MELNHTHVIYRILRGGQNDSDFGWRAQNFCHTSTHFKYYRGEHILSDAKSALRENAKMQTRADELLKVRLRRAIFTCLYYFTWEHVRAQRVYDAP